MSSHLSNKAAVLGRFVVLLGSYVMIVFLSLLAALFLRFDFSVAPEYWTRFWNSIVWLLPLKMGMLGIFGQFRTLLTYFSLPDAKRLAAAMGSCAFIALAYWFVTGGLEVVPRGVIVTDMVLSFLGLATFRIGLRIYRERLSDQESGVAASRKRRAVIVGAGSSGAALLRDIQGRRGIGVEVVCFVDDDRRKIGGTLHGKPVVGPVRKISGWVRELDIQKVIFAMPKAKPAVIRSLVEKLNAIGIEPDILPSVTQLVHRQVTVEHLRHVNPEDLLGREPVALNETGIGSLLKDKIILVTGAGGSIGSELCRQIADQNPHKLVLLERAEPALFAIEQELRASHPHLELVCSTASACDEQSLACLFCEHQPHLVFHAAAHKHVPLMESQPYQALRNNARGTEIAARLAQQHGVKKFILVSTDKAVNPTNVMGATKRLAEMILEEKQTNDPNGCAFSAVRFGNVLGSSGSVVPTFRRQIAKGGPVTVTHPEVTRYFMSIPEAVGLILQSALQSKGGEIFVLDMGNPIKIVDLARQMIELCGFKPDEDIKVVFTGLRPGEKLYEEPIHEMENVEPTEHPKIRRLRNGRANPASGLAKMLEESCRDVDTNAEKIRFWLRERVPEYGEA
jgi:FlaA1/EpsC-like NDP-sugar epimerase